MTGTLKLKTALITGAALGLGLAIARKLSIEGVRLALLDNNSTQLDGIRQELAPDCYTCVTDITKEEEVMAAVDEIAGRYGRIDILINSAGITGRTNLKSHETDSSDLRRVFDVNFMGSYYTSKYVLPVMPS